MVHTYNHRDTHTFVADQLQYFFPHLTPKYQPRWLQQKHFWLVSGRCMIWVLATTLTILTLLWFYYSHSGRYWDSTLNYVTLTTFHITMKALVSNYTSHWCCTALQSVDHDPNLVHITILSGSLNNFKNLLITNSHYIGKCFKSSNFFNVNTSL